MEPSSLHPMESHGLPGLLEHQILSMELPTETIPSWQWVIMEPSLPLRMILPLETHGLPGLLEQRILSVKSPTETVSS